MPTYEYRCPAGHDFEKFYRKISDAGAEVPCPTCGKIAERLISAGAGLVFKGSGFYITDYGKDGKKDHPAAARSKSRGEGSGESSPGGNDGSGGGDAAAGSDSKAAPDTKSGSDTKAASDTKAGSDTKAASAESKPAATRESAKKEPPKPDSSRAKPNKPSTE